ncbi:hypothetical protein [Streptomyces niveus]|uniref:hypothetical protein n=1 Tax=Streptomyces niveus TaxID=193462 RepID=UPI0037B67B8E
MITTLSRPAARPQAADPTPAPDLPPLPKREPGKTLTDAVAEFFDVLGTDSDPDMDEALRRVRTGGGK